jgi:hypothetical protein
MERPSWECRRSRCGHGAKTLANRGWWSLTRRAAGRAGLALAAGLLGVVALGCASEPPGAAEGRPAPTTSPIFQGSPLPAPTKAATGVARSPGAVPTPRIRQQTSPTPVQTPRAAEVRTEEVVIFDDDIHGDWSLDRSQGVRYDPRSTAYVHDGTYSLAVTPTSDYGTLLFSVREGASTQYLRDRLLEVRLWLNSGAQEVANDAFTITVIGSHAQPHWVPDDRSVMLDERSFFSETRLYYLGVNRAIPPETWVDLTIKMDDLPYEPDYRYVTGVYLKADAGVRDTIHLDRLTLLMLEAQP